MSEVLDIGGFVSSLSPAGFFLVDEGLADFVGEEYYYFLVKRVSTSVALVLGGCGG